MSGAGKSPREASSWAVLGLDRLSLCAFPPGVAGKSGTDSLRMF